jgi:hypothetical protein
MKTWFEKSALPLFLMVLFVPAISAEKQKPRLACTAIGALPLTAEDSGLYSCGFSFGALGSFPLIGGLEARLGVEYGELVLRTPEYMSYKLPLATVGLAYSLSIGRSWHARIAADYGLYLQDPAFAPEDELLYSEIGSLVNAELSAAMALGPDWEAECFSALRLLTDDYGILFMPVMVGFRIAYVF